MAQSRVLRSAGKITQSPAVGNTQPAINNTSPSKQACRNLMKLSKESAYQKAKEVLYTATPDFLIGREMEAGQVSAYLSDHLTNGRSGSIYISGAPGTGKTAVLSKVIEKHKVDFSNNRKHTGNIVYVNCMSVKNAQGIYRTILESLHGAARGNKNCVQLSAKQAQKEIETSLLEAETWTVLILDEIDSLDSRNQDVLYTIFDWPTWFLPKPLLLVGVANSLDLTDRILPRLQAHPHCKPHLLHFSPYSKDQIVAVLDERLSQIEGEPVFDKAAIQFLARKVSSMSGDVRIAIDIARRSVELAESEVRKQLKLEASNKENVCSSPSKQSKLRILKKVGVAQVMKVVNEVYGSRLGGGGASKSVVAEGGTYPLQQTLCVCTLLMMSQSGRGKEVLLGMLHEAYTSVCKRHGVSQIDQSEFLSLCSLLESRGLLSLKRFKDTRNSKICLRVDEMELENALQDRTLMTNILSKGL